MDIFIINYLNKFKFNMQKTSSKGDDACYVNGKYNIILQLFVWVDRTFLNK